MAFPEKSPPLRGWIRDNPALVVVGTVCTLSAIFYLSVIRPDTSQHAGFVVADIQHVLDADQSSITQLRLPDGSLHDISTNALALSSETAGQVCLEKRTKPTGEVIFLKTKWRNCQTG